MPKPPLRDVNLRAEIADCSNLTAVIKILGHQQSIAVSNIRPQGYNFVSPIYNTSSHFLETTRIIEYAGLI